MVNVSVHRKRWEPPDRYSYSWLLGFYLGDGCITSPRPGQLQLRVVLDEAYPGIVDDCATVVGLTALESRVTVRPARLIEGGGRRVLLAPLAGVHSPTRPRSQAHSLDRARTDSRRSG